MKRLPDEALARQLDEFLSQDSKALAAQSARLYDQVAAPADRGMVLFGAGALGHHVLAGMRKAGLAPLAILVTTCTAVCSSPPAGSARTRSAPGACTIGSPDHFAARRSELIPLGRMADVDEYQGRFCSSVPVHRLT